MAEFENKTNRAGIKHPSFTPGGNNGQSHRANKVKKARQADATRQARRELNQERGRMAPIAYHARQEAISKGLV